MTHKDYALEIIKTLNQAGYVAYFAGGWVRDYIIQHPSDDIDIATNASPEVVMELFPHTIKVGLAFGIVIVVIKGHQFEVATFRKDLGYSGGRRPDKIMHSSAEEDAARRDFTINGMFYDPLNDLILDYVQGLSDLKQGVIRTIGDPKERFMEDRLRMIRAIRFAARFGFEIDPDTERAIQENAHTLFPAVAMERVWQEFNKMAKAPRFDQALFKMHQLGLLSTIFPSLEEMSEEALRARVASFSQFPKGTPPILYLMYLFPEHTLDELLEIAQYLRTSGDEGKLLEFAYKGKYLLTQETLNPASIPNREWAHFYAHRFFQTCFEAITKGQDIHRHEEILQRHFLRREKLLPHILRLVEKKPLITAKILQEQGISPGKEMGDLLKEAENLALTYDLHDPTAILELLKKSPIWPNG